MTTTEFTEAELRAALDTMTGDELRVFLAQIYARCGGVN